MEPFIARFAKSQLVTPKRKRVNYEYNADTDCNLTVDTHKMVMDEAEALYESTGTLYTATQSDPTCDEPTDR
jgi:hypothetical protein